MQVSVCGHVPYAEWLARQEQLVRARRDGRCPDQLALAWHEPVVTVGRSAAGEHLPDRRNLGARGVSVHEVTRGGAVTYHGPGMLMGYPVLDLRALGLGLHEYLDGLEGVLVGALRDSGVEGGVRPEVRGAWVGERKIAAVGVAVRRWISYHGFALNVDCDLEPFGLIVPCGMPGTPTTNMTSELGRGVSCDDVVPLIVDNFIRAFGHSLCNQPLWPAG